MEGIKSSIVDDNNRARRVLPYYSLALVAYPLVAFADVTLIRLSRWLKENKVNANNDKVCVDYLLV